MLELEDLYQELILDHCQRPHHFGTLDGATHHAKGYNPLCGDEVEVFVQVLDGCIKAISFIGEGCAISKASASMMTDELLGKTLEEAVIFFEAFHNMLTQEEAVGEKLGKSQVFLGVKQFPVRVKCATLGWHTFKSALDRK